MITVHIHPSVSGPSRQAHLNALATLPGSIRLVDDETADVLVTAERDGSRSGLRVLTDVADAQIAQRALPGVYYDVPPLWDEAIDELLEVLSRDSLAPRAGTITATVADPERLPQALASVFAIARRIDPDLDLPEVLPRADGRVVSVVASSADNRMHLAGVVGRAGRSVTRVNLTGDGLSASGTVEDGLDGTPSRITIAGASESTAVQGPFHSAHQTLWMTVLAQLS